jgi:hypothetical protein
MGTGVNLRVGAPVAYLANVCDSRRVCSGGACRRSTALGDGASQGVYLTNVGVLAQLMILGGRQ